MEENEKIVIAKDWIYQLANGINPLNGATLKEDDVVNNIHISRCLFYVADLLGKFSEKKKKTGSSRNIPFDSSVIQLDKYDNTQPMSITAFIKEVEKLIPENMKVVNYKTIVQWLVQEEMLIESAPDSNGRTFKMATEKGATVGIYCEQRERNGRVYNVTLYNRDAQIFILEHLEEISKAD